MRGRILGVVASLLVCAGPVAVASEQPEYEVLRTTQDFELRRYGERWVAETVVAGDFGQARNAAFRRLFDYISGANRGRTEIAMTSPVTTSEAGAREAIEMTSPVVSEARGEAQRMRFFLPAKLAAVGAPEPVDPTVQLRLLPPQVFAARRYSGRANEANYRREQEALLQALQAAGLSTAGPPQLAVYDGPFTPPFWRRNEVLVPVEFD